MIAIADMSVEFKENFCDLTNIGKENNAMSVLKELKMSYHNFYEGVRDLDNWKVVVNDVVYAYSEFGRGIKQLVGLEEMEVKNQNRLEVIENLKYKIEAVLEIDLEANQNESDKEL